MKTLRQRSAVAAVALAVGMMGFMTACGKDEKTPPSTTTTTTTTTPASSEPAPPPSPTEKAPGGGPNSFSPTVKAPPAPTAIPGDN